MKRFPDVSSLAAATEDEVNSMWSGLGYYRRAQNLRKVGKLPGIRSDLV
jgi:A/G-specific adenine glycosylase